MHRWVGTLAATFALVVAGCGGEQGGGPFGSTRTVEATRKATHITASGKMDVAQNLTEVEVSALTLKDGEFTSVAGSGDADGNIEIEGVPNGTYYFRFKRSASVPPLYIVTDESHLDLSYLELGRPDIELASKGTTLSIDGATLGPWEPLGQDLHVIAPNANLIGLHAEEYLVSQPPMEGETPATLTFDYARLQEQFSEGSPLVDAARGDEVYVTRLRWTTYAAQDSVQSYDSLDLALHATNLTVANGGSNSLSGAFSAPSTSRSLSLDWRRESFEALSTQVHPEGKRSYDYFQVMTQPYGTAETGFFSGTADFAIGFPPDPGNHLIPISWKNPYPEEWIDGLRLGHFTRVVFQSSAGAMLFANAMTLVTLDVSNSTSVIAEPVVTPPQDVRVDGSSSSAEMRVGPTPHLSWSPPGSGTPGHYYVNVVQLATDGSQRQSRVARILTHETNVTIPPEVLVPGNNYVFVVGAVKRDPEVPITRPYPSSLTYSYSEGISGLVKVE